MTSPAHRKKVLLTGAAGHLGRRIAAHLASSGCHLALSDVDAAGLASLAAELTDETTAGHGSVVSIPVDVTDAQDARAAVGDAQESLGGLDVLVNAHGIEGPTAPVEALDPDDVRRTFDVNVMSLFWLCGTAAEIFKTAGGGRIVNLASGAGLAGGAFTGVYHASKHAVVGLTRSLALELGPAGITVNAVCPGFVESPMVDRIVSSLGDLDLPTEYAHMVPLGRYADPDEVAETVRYLACEAPEYMTGTCLVLDGGLRA
ncbi:MAG: SDR family NAD(P)-dependent oxidoreductase [bacterium]|nr:SDR family NAD(P)-dependent oxidoreductase [bacterium]